MKIVNHSFLVCYLIQRYIKYPDLGLHSIAAASRIYYKMVDAWLSMSVVGLIVVLFVCFLCSGFRSPLSTLLYFITVFLLVCVSLSWFTDAVEDPYANFRKKVRASKTILSPHPTTTTQCFWYWPFQGVSSVTVLVFLCLCVCDLICGLCGTYLFMISPSFAVLRDCGISWVSSLVL